MLEAHWEMLLGGGVKEVHDNFYTSLIHIS